VADNDLTLDTLGGCGDRPGLRIRQPKKGHRFGLEAVALAAFVRVKPGETLVDLGTGVGVIPLLLAHTKARLIGVEIQPELAELARKNADQNGVDLQVIEGDFQGVKDLLPPHGAQVVVCNPPFFEAGRGRVSPDRARATARQAGRAVLGEVVLAARYLLKDKGRLNLIGPAARLVDLLAIMRQGGLEPKRLRMVHGRPDKEARLVLIEGRLGAGVECVIEPPLFPGTGQESGWGGELENFLSRVGPTIKGE